MFQPHRHLPGLAPEIVRFPGDEGPVVDAGSKHSLLRPEAVESFFIMYAQPCRHVHPRPY